MSIKDLFDKGYSSKSIKNKSQEEIRGDIESQRYLEGYTKKSNRFLPDTDFTSASNFARYGLAELYYENSIKRVYQTYPYDGSRAEKIEWENESTYLDLFIFENEYPRFNGYIALNTGSHTYSSTKTANTYSSSLPQYVYFLGGPHPDPSGDYKSDFSAGPSKKGVSKANIYHTGSQRANNLEFDLDKGATIEFWMKKDGFPTVDGVLVTAREYFFHISSIDSVGRSIGGVSGSVLRTSPGNFTIGVSSGSTTSNVTLDTGLSSVADGVWRHYAFTVKNQGATPVYSLYVNGVHTAHSVDTDNTISAVTGTMVGALGAKASKDDNGAYGPGWGNARACSFDEFRYWKAERNGQQVGRHYLSQVAGGTNTDNIKYDDISNKVDLGVYFKFNEGVTGDSNTDSTILDYSGRISNGAFINYNSSESRYAGSAIVSASAAAYEFKDPIVYSHHPEVITLLENKKAAGSMHDGQNFFSIYHSLPAWILEEDEKKSHHLKFLTQVIASYFDNMFLQIQKVPRLRDINYPYDSDHEKPLPFAGTLLSSRGYDVPELFADAHKLAKYLQRDERGLFEKKLYEIKNTIYQNIYNNLSFINKSKGTLKSLRNFLRCFGVDEDLIRLNIYSVNGEYEFKDNFTNKSYIKKYLDFDDPETRYSLEGRRSNAYTATAYQYIDSDDSNSLSYIPALTSMISGSSFTLETEVIFPKRSIKGDDNYQLFPATTASIFGMHAVDKTLIEADSTHMAFASTDDINFTIAVSKPHDDKRNVKFAVISSDASAITSKESDLFTGVYDNEKWNLAFSVFPTKYPLAPRVTGSLDGDYPYSYELYGVNYVSNTIQNEFTLSGSLTLEQGLEFFRKPKSIFIGAERTNFSGSVDKISDVKISSVRYWVEKLSNRTIQGHAQDASNVGTLRPYQNRNLHLVSGGFQPQLETLALHWSMGNVTGSDANGRFLIHDFNSGSIGERTKPRYPGLSEVSEYSYPGRGDFFAASTDQAVDIEFVPTGRQKLPEIINSDDMVRVLNKYDDVVFKKDNSYVNHILSVEKSMYQTISEEMLKMFSTIVDFNNLIGEPVNRYRSHYKVMEKLRDSFFQNVENEPDLDKFLEFYKWLDDAVTSMIQQLIPISSNTTKLLRNMVESHILERNKYWFKFPTLESEPPKIIGTLRGIEELNYNWKFGHAPVNANQNTNQDISCLWWNQRAERSGSASGQAVLTSGDINLDADKAVILKRMVTEVSGSTAMLRTSAGTKYGKGYYPIRSLGRAVEFKSERTTLDFKGGSNSNQTNKHDFYKGVIKWGSDDDFIFIDVDNEIKSKACNDQLTPLEITKKKFNVKALTMRANETLNSDASGLGINDKTIEDSKASLLMPMSIHSSSIESGYRNRLRPYGLDFTNMHEDKYGFDAEIPLQGPFSEQHVGGNQHRHVKINQGTDSAKTRPEGWSFQKFLDIVKDTATQNILTPEYFAGATSTPTTDVRILNLPEGSSETEPSPYEYWKNGIPETAAMATIAVANGSAAIAVPEKKYIIITSAAGVTKRYVLTDTSAGGVATGTVLSDSADTDTGTGTAGSDEDGGVAVGLSSARPKEHEFLVQLKAAIEHTNGHNGAIIVSPVPAEAAAPEEITLFQAVPGISGNTTISTDLSILTIVSFSGGEGACVGSNPWTFLLGATPTVGTGPGAGSNYAYCEVLPAKVGQSFGLVTPLIDLLEYEADAYVYFTFKYHMHGLHIGDLKIQASQDPNFLTDVEDLLIDWNGAADAAGRSTVLSGQQQTTETQSFISAYAGTRAYGNGLASWVGKRFYIRFLYTAGVTQLGDCAIDAVKLYVTYPSNTSRDSFKLVHPTFDNHHWPSATYTRQEYAKRPVNIRNIELTGSSPTRAGNFANRYEYVSTVSPESNDPFFVKNQSQITSIYPEKISRYKIENLLSSSGPTERGSVGRNFTLPNRAFLSGNIKNKTRIMTRFSSPGGFETLSRGFLDPAHETYSVYNATTYRNLSVRAIHNTQLQAHQGQYGVSTHTNIENQGRAAGSMTFNVISITNYNAKTFKIFDGSETYTFKVNNTLNSGSSYILNSVTRTVTFGLTNASNIVQVRDAFNGAISTAINRGTDGTKTEFNLQAKVTSTNPRTKSVDSNVLYIENLIPGEFGNASLQNVDHVNITFSPGTTYEGANPTARVFGTEVSGTISALDYRPRVAVGSAGIYPGGVAVSSLGPGGGAAAHKYHRNNIERMKYIGDAPEDTNGNITVFVTASFYDNGFVSHMIPRTDQQTRWITGSII